MYQVIIVIHVLLGLGIIGLILMQQGKGADAGAAFGTGASGSVFGAQGAASFLSRTTAILASLFFITSLTLAVLNSRQGTVHDLMSESADTPSIPADKAQAPADTAMPPVAPGVTEASKVNAPVNSQPAAPEIKETEVPKAPDVKAEQKPAIKSK
jgi:preprotein translocase subunit SecG